MRDGGGVNFYGFSSRHIRLKYQAVTSAIVAALISSLPIQSINLPGFVTFSGTPPTWLVQVAVIIFGVFSLVAFHFQTRIERKHIPLTGMLFRNEIERQSRDLIDKVRSLTGESFEVYQKTIIKELSSLPPKNFNQLSAIRWQPIAAHFFAVETAAKFAQIQIESHKEAVSQEIYQGSSSFDVHYSNTLDIFTEKLEGLIHNLWRPNDLRTTIGGIQYSSNVIEDLKHLNLTAASLIKQHQGILEDLNEYVELKELNQETLSVYVPYGLCAGLLSFSIAFPLIKFIGCES